MRRLLQAIRPDPLALVLLALAAVGMLVAGAQHARLFHFGYAEVEIVGPLFPMNAIGSLVVVLTLVFGRVWIFVLGAISVCVPSLVSIAISHSSIGFLGFREGGYDLDALVIVIAEITAVVFALVGAAVAVRAEPSGGQPSIAARAPIAVAVAAAIGCAISRRRHGPGARRGRAGARRHGDRGFAGTDRRRRRRRARRGRAVRRRGLRPLPLDRGERPPTASSARAWTRLTRTPTTRSRASPTRATTSSTAIRRSSCPTIFDERLDDAELRALAAFVTAASGAEQDGREDENGGRGRGRGRSGGDGKD